MSLLPLSWKRSIRSLALLGGLWFTSPANAAPQTLHVTNNNATGAGSLFAAIVAADAGGPGTQTIVFDKGVTTINLTEHLPILDNNITIQGPLDRTVTINGQQITRVFYAYSGNIQINSVNIIQGNATGGTGGFSNTGGGAGGGGLVWRRPFREQSRKRHPAQRHVSR